MVPLYVIHSPNSPLVQNNPPDFSPPLPSRTKKPPRLFDVTVGSFMTPPGLEPGSSA